MKYLFFVLLLIANSVFAINENKIVSDFISSKNTSGETVSVSDTISGQLIESYEIENDLYIVHWLYQGANYWQHRIYLIKGSNGKVEELDKLFIDGDVKYTEYSKNILKVMFLSYGKTIPRCCPDVEKKLNYKVQGNKFLLE
ncbi:hypothetical protein [Psychromonas aquimarina]|uniref:hypothetical protein n=1 Tax=Psychromonas aquimarina TaxID=444919 RepID=UPI000404D520|nr:hypothetical protein [Psychromonas aquimarina]